MKVKFLPQDVEHEIKPGQSVMNVAHENGIHIQSVCKGLPSCAECRVQVVEGATNVLPPFAEELNLIGTAHFVDQRRLSCQLRCFGDLTVNLSEQIEKESTSTMQPRGRFKKEEGDSLARLGNILEEAAPQVELEIDPEEAKDVLKDFPIKKEAENKTGQQKKKSKNKNRNRNNRKNFKGKKKTNHNDRKKDDKPKDKK